MNAHVSGRPRVELEVVVKRADGRVEPPMRVAASLVAEDAARLHPSRIQRIKWGLRLAWLRLLTNLSEEND